MTTTIENADSAPYWAAARDGRLLLQRCGDCGHIQFPPRRLCNACWAEEPGWIESSGRGTLESMTIVHRAPLPEFRDLVPYAVASVLLEEGPRMITNLVGPGALEARIGAAVVVTFQPGKQGHVLPQFRLTE